LADGDVVANAGLHRDLVQLTVTSFEHQHAAPGDERLGLDLGVVQLQAQPLAGVDVDQLGGIGHIRRRQQHLVAPRLGDAARVGLERKGGRIKGGHRYARAYGFSCQRSAISHQLSAVSESRARTSR
jgi:hypothetical protein